MMAAGRALLGLLLCALVMADGVGAAASEGAAVPATRIDLNTATAAELDGLPGVGRKRAHAIIAKRPYKRVTELLRIKGFGPKLFARVREYVTVAGSPAAKERLDGLGKP